MVVKSLGEISSPSLAFVSVLKTIRVTMQNLASVGVSAEWVVAGAGTYIIYYF